MEGNKMAQRAFRNCVIGADISAVSSDFVSPKY
jgi:hypothetical protein